MLNLMLREEFLKKNLRGTVIDFRSQKHDGATEIAPEDFLKITYPTADVLKAVSCLREDTLTGPVVLMGGRGKGKSHLMAVLHHCIKSLKANFHGKRFADNADPQTRFLPPLFLVSNGTCMVTGQRKWPVPGGFPRICHGGLSLLEVASPWIELPGK